MCPRAPKAIRIRICTCSASRALPNKSPDDPRVGSALSSTPLVRPNDLITQTVRWAVPAVAALMLGLTVAPAEIWNHPAIDAVYKGFDPNLVYANGGGSKVVRVSTDAIDITATPNSQPRVNLATTSLKTLNASLDLLVIENKGASEPFRIGVLSPWTRLGYLLAFEPQNRLTAETIEHGTGAALIHGDVHPLATLGTYTPGITYHL